MLKKITIYSRYFGPCLRCGVLLHKSPRATAPPLPEGGEIPGVYSDTMLITPNLTLTPEQFRSILLNRRYREVDKKPENPGEFSRRGSVYELVTTEFRSAEGNFVKPSVVVWDMQAKRHSKSLPS